MTRRHRLFNLLPDTFLSMLRGEVFVASDVIPKDAVIREMKFHYDDGLIHIVVESESYPDLGEPYVMIQEPLPLFNKISDIASLMRVSAQLAENLPTEVVDGERVYIKKII